MAKSTVPSALLRAGRSDCATCENARAQPGMAVPRGGDSYGDCGSEIACGGVTNEPFIDFSNAENRKKMEAALAKVKAEFGHEYPMWIAGQKVITTGKKKSTNPSAAVGSDWGVPRRVRRSRRRRQWRRRTSILTSGRRCRRRRGPKYLFKAAQIVRERKFELGALVCYEVGKSWIEADADVCRDD